MTESLNASTESNQGKEITPNQRPMETVTERLKRLTKEAINGGQHNKFGPSHSQEGGPVQSNTGKNLGVPGAHASNNPDEILHRIMRDATQPRK